ncbi:hypothetical protein [Faecalimicrobium sp. JNUCC 81]
MIIIRSQERDAAGRYMEVKVDECMVKGISAFGTMTVIGVYKSRERAIKVLDYIHKFIEDGSQRDYMDKKCRIKQEMVFNMPLK